jgi:hypothetical protein
MSDGGAAKPAGQWQLEAGECGETDVDAGAAAVVAGTLCLMSCFAQHPLALYAQRVAGNLQRLAADAAMTPELRSVCRRLADQWDGLADDATRTARSGRTPDDRRPLH